MHHYFEAITNTSGDSLIGYYGQVIDPATQNVVPIYADDNGTPIVTLSGFENLAETDDYGNLDFYVVPGTYNLVLYAPNATSQVFRVLNVAMSSDKGDPGPQGLQGDQGEGLAEVMEPTGSTLVGFKQYGTKALPLNLLAKERERPLSVFDFLSVADQNSIREKEFDYSREARITQAINDCFDEARPKSSRDVPRSTYAPDGGYPVGNLIFGTNDTGAQSAAPAGFTGSSKEGVQLRARAGLTGDLFKAQSLAGVELSSFTLNTIGSSARALNMDWLPGEGPSTNNRLDFVSVLGGTAATHVSMRNLNDTEPLKLLVRASSPEQVCIDMYQPGGYTILHRSQWTIGYLKTGAQNLALYDCYGTGVMAASGALNQMAFYNCQIYPNPFLGCHVKSESKSVGQSIKSFMALNTIFIPIDVLTNYRAPCIFDVNLYSGLKLDGCTITGTPGANINLLSTTSRRDSFSDALITIENGAKGGPLILNDVAGFKYARVSGFIDDVTAAAITKDYSGTFTPVVAGATSAGTATYSTQMGNWWREGNRISFAMRATWTGHTGTGPLIIQGFPYSNTSGVDVPVSVYAGGTFGAVTPSAILGTNNTATFYNGAAILPGTGTTAIPATGDIILSGSYQVSA